MTYFLLKISIFFVLLSSVSSDLDTNGNSSGGKNKLKILVNNPGLSFSHMQFQGKLADVLVEAGHEVHVLRFDQNPNVGDYNGTFKAHRIIRESMSQEKKEAILKMPIMNNPFDGSSNMYWNGMMDHMRKLFANLCEDIVKEHQPLLRKLAKENYDVGISESHDPCFFGILHAMGVKTKIGTFAIAMTNLAGAPFGIPNVPSYVINRYAPSVSGPNMNFWERALNFYSYVQEYFVERDKTYAMEQQFFNDIYGPKFSSLWSIAQSVSLCFVNGNEFFELPRPLSNKIINIGGIASDIFDKSPDKKLTLSAEVQSIFNNTKDGVVLFSFGTIANTKAMTHQMKTAFLTAFAQFPTYDFIWKMERDESDSEIFSNAPNVHTFGWLKQKAILAQPKLKAFITHCGLNSMTESASEGVPMIGIPLFGDQTFNAATLNHKHSGVFVDIRDMHSESKGSNALIDALKKVLYQPEYSQNAKVIQKKLLNIPFKPKEKFVKWVEFAAEFPDLNELNLPTKSEMSLFVYYSLDVVSFSVVVLCSVWNMLTKEHIYARLLSIKSLARRNEVGNPENDMVETFWWNIGDLLLNKFYIGALSISAPNVANVQTDNRERELFLSQFRPALQNCFRITIENHLPHFMDLLDRIFDNDRKRYLLLTWISHSSHFGHHYSTYSLFLSGLERRFQSATSIVPFKFIFQFHGYLEQDVADYVNRHSNIINSKAAKMLNIKAIAALTSQIIVSVEEKES